MLTLKDRNWKAFYFTNVFTEIKRGKRLKKADHKEGKLPYISSTSQNNGIDGFIGNNTSVRIFNNCLTLANSGSVGCSFYHKYEFIASDHVTQLKRDGLDKYAYLFMIPIINRLSEKYSFNREINDERIKREKLLLPVTDKGDIDFQFMSAFMKRFESNILETSIHVFEKRLNINKSNRTRPNTGGGVQYSDYQIDSLFNILAGKRLTKSEMIKGSRPFIGASENNNGITTWVSNSNNSIDSNVLGVNYNGSVVESFYHPYECLFSDDVKRFHLKNGITSKYIFLYIKTAILQQKSKYAYGYKFNEKRMQNQKILLPSTPQGEPDWIYMEQYMRNIESEQIIKYLSLINDRVDIL